jgi:hypothetical protein
LQLTPNPAQNDILITVSDIMAPGLTFEIRNVLGAVIISRQNLTNNQRIDVNALVHGVYILTVSNKEGQISKQFVKI